MSERHDDIADMLSETKRLLGDLKTPEGEEFSLDNILAEYGQGAAEPAQKEADVVKEELPEVELPVPVSPVQPELPKPNREKVLQFPRMFANREESSEPAPVEEEQEAVTEEPVKEMQQEVSLEELLSRTVQSALEEQDDELLDEPLPLKERLGAWGTKIGERLRPLLDLRVQRRHVQEDETPEPEMEQAAKEAKRLCRRLYRQWMFTAVPAVLLAVVSIFDTGWPQLFPVIWFENAVCKW